MSEMFGADQVVRKRVDVVIPVLNEERDLRNSVAILRQFLGSNLKLRWRIVIVDNGSTDRTFSIAQQLAQKNTDVAFISVGERGRGRALRKAWLESEADVLTYMDVDLSTDLNAFPHLVAAIAEEGYDLAIGSRLAHGAQVFRRSMKREILSRGYNLLIRLLFWHGFSDAQCGFKAISLSAARALLPFVEDNRFFFDTELLLIAEKSNYRIKDLPVRWTDDPDTRVHIMSTVAEDVKGLVRLRFGGVPEVVSDRRREDGKV
jgi:glycosyltransferase involved in cell wall biosynthesis